MGVLLLGSCLFVSAQSSDFSIDNDGWTAAGFSGSYLVPPAKGLTVQWVTNGNPGGAIRLTDIAAETFFDAPSKYLGNKAAAYGQTLEFETYVTSHDNAAYPMVILEGPNKTEVCYTGPIPPLSTWWKVSVPLAPTANWHYGGRFGAQPTVQEFQNVLADLKGLYIIAEWHTGGDDTMLDNVRFGQGPDGYVQLQDWVGTDAPVSCQLDFFSQGSLVASKSLVLGPDGSFSLDQPIAPGLYDVAVKASHWLNSVNVAVQVIAGQPLMLVSGRNGDIDGDNSVTVFDYGILSDYFDRSSADSDWTALGDNGFRPADADLDGDGSVSVFDYGILSDSFDLSGD